jgi:hypothetical protein
MAWTAPLTFVAGNVLTAAQLNQQLRDNMLTTAPALATTAGGIFAVTGTNAIAQRLLSQNEVLTAETTASTTYVALATAQAVTVTTGTQAIVFLSAQLTNATAGNESHMGYAVSGATTVAAADSSSLLYVPATASTHFMACSRAFYHTGLTAGSNTFTAQFRSSAATNCQARNRQIFVIPL